MDYEDYIIRMNELDKPQSASKKEKSSKPKRFLGSLLEKPLEIDFSKDKKSSFTPLPSYRRDKGDR